jgi:ATP-dependent DNA helicase DinG
MKFETLVTTLDGSVRTEQTRLVNDLLEHGSAGICGFNAATGIGKTLAYLFAAYQRKGRVVVAVPTHNLSAQVMATAERINRVRLASGMSALSVVRRMGIQEYLSPSRVQKSVNFAGLDEKDPLVAALIAASISNGDGNLYSNFIGEFGELPAGLSRSDLVCTSKDADSSALSEDRVAEKLADVVIISHALLLLPGLLERMELSAEKDLLIVDEADSIIPVASSLFGVRIAVSRISRLGGGAGLESLVSELGDGLHMAVRHKAIFPQVLRAIDEIEELYESDASDAKAMCREKLIQFLALGTTNAGLSVTNGNGALVQLSRFAARVMKDRMANFQATWLLSGTLDVSQSRKKGMPWLCGKFGIEQADVKFYGFYEPSDYGTLKLMLAKTFPAPFVGDREDINPEFVQACAISIGQCLAGKALICTASYEENRLLVAALKKNGVSVVEDRSGSSINTMIEQFRAAPEQSVFCTPRASVGVDIRAASGGQLFDLLVITRMPFAPPMPEHDANWHSAMAGISVDKIQSFEYADNLQKSVRKMSQTLGRGIRSETDSCTVMILDNRFPGYGETRHSIFKGVIPERFKSEHINAVSIRCENGVFSDQGTDMEMIL